ncbi:MAG: SGNH/GDSL hydrolase family protein [Clostridia bacterium]|nr:SGNH/GDSL hydrolase family protein [Clostridia bacterium]
MKNITRIICLLLAMFMITVSLSSCLNTQENDDENDPEQNVVFDLTKEHLGSYVIIIPSQMNEDMLPNATYLKDALEQAYGIRLEIKTDEVEATEYEILIGLTNRTETAELYLTLKDSEYGYALIGNKLLIVGKSADNVNGGLLLFEEDVLKKTDAQGILLSANSKKIAEAVEVTTTVQTQATTNSNKDQYEYYADVLEGLTVNALGDSYFDGEGLNRKKVWLGLLATKYKMKMNNYGKGGSTVSNYVNKNPMCIRYSSMSNNNADIILLEGGRNDFNQGVPIGATDSHDKKTFSGALNVIIEGLKEKYPNAMIVCISNWNFPGTKNGLDYTDYADAMEAVAEQQDVCFIRACDPEVSGINMKSTTFRAQYCMNPDDISHLNAAGMKIAMEHFEKILAEYYQDFLDKK